MNNDLINEQIAMEERFLSDSTLKYEHSMSRMVNAGLFANTTEGSILQKMAIEAIATKIDEYMNTPVRGAGSKYNKWVKENFEGRSEIVAFTIVEYLLNTIATRTTKVTQLAVSLTTRLLELLSVEEFKKNEPKFYSYLEYEYKSRGIGYINTRKKKLAKLTANNINEAENVASVFKANIGARLIDCVINSGCGIFQVRLVREGKKTAKILVFTADALKIVGRVNDNNVLFGVTYKPLLVEPLPWTSLWDNGGYYTENSLSFIRNTKSCRYIDLHEDEYDLTRVYSVINHIQNTKWKINNFILTVVNQIINGGMIDPKTPTGNPKFYGDLPYMDSLDIYAMVPKERYGTLDKNGNLSKEDFTQWYKAKEIQLKKLEANRSKRIMFTLAHNLATEYKDRDCFYFTYNTDFRGRLYPIQQILNPQSTGAVKSFLTFAEAKHLDESGLYWLKIHCANNYGIDKLSFDARIAWVDNNMAEILRNARDPMTTVEVWNESDEPLMYLASCKALLDHSNGLSVALPISLDATCSGLQLYSGLLKDKEGAEAVNVVDRTDEGTTVKPADVYTDVANRVEHYLAIGEYPKEFTFTTTDKVQKVATTVVEADDLRGNVTRKLTKRNVMTVPYSVTTRGMFAQVNDLLTEMEDDETVFWKGDKWVVAKLLVELNSISIEDVVHGATTGQDFIKEVVKDYYSSEEEKPLIWTTPHFNFPVIQWKLKTKEKKVQSVFGYLTLRSSTNKINKQQQTNGIAPNLIHSLDSTLMYLAIEKLQSKGVNSFMLIHDSFGVPANDIQHLNTAVREAFVELFQGNPLEAWVEQVHPEYVEEARTIMVNTLDLNEVTNSTYIFS